MRGRDAPGGFHRLPKGAYARLSLQEKQRLVRQDEREDPLRCPTCGMQLLPEELVRHMRNQNRCPGPAPADRGEPLKNARYVSWREAMQMGVNRQTLSRWSKQGHVRWFGERQDRKYLLRDLARKIAQRWGFRRR